PLDTKHGENVEGIDPKEKTAGIDQTYALSISDDGLVYHTAPLPNETPLIGCPAVTLWVSIDTPDTDLSADLYEIQPDGTSIALWSDIRRLRYRESLREAKLVKPGEIDRCDFNPGLFVVGVICLVGTQARAEPEIVIAIRYLQAQGTSHSHLYLYREDGKLLRQLTKDNSGQDADPIFTSDGETIVFARGRSDNTREFWSIDRRGTGLKKLDAAPDWYAQTKSSPYFTNIEPEEQTSPTPT